MIRLQQPLPDTYVDATEEDLTRRIAAARAKLGDELLILGHHYQRDEVYRWADATGDSFKLAQHAQDHPEARWIVFCGVHFMAESADVLTNDDQIVILPDLNAGCSMADMADTDQVTDCWDDLAATVGTDRIIPITYMNSSAALKAFVGEHGGAVCTSSNARAVLTWALEDQGAEKVLFFPDQHLGRNTAVQLGHPLESCVVWNPHRTYGGLTEADVADATFLLWKGHCSVHQRFTPELVAQARAEDPDVQVIVHPECPHETVVLADHVGSTEVIKRVVNEAPAGSHWAVGTEVHMVHRLADTNPDKVVRSLDPLVCPCSTMFRIDAPHLCWTLENLVAGNVVNRIEVPADVTHWSRVALQRMLDIT
jgi:quinolinate synthase